MTLHYTDDHLDVHVGDCREVLATLPAESVHCVVTSPPYWGLRDYGIGGQLGLEPTPEAYVANMVEVFREVRRVLRKDGTCWVNMGDGYAAARGGTTMPAETLAGGEGGWMPDGSRVNRDRHDGYSPSRNAGSIGLKHKDLIGMPWRLAFALQADGWYLRSDIIWAKPNPMPESVTDRPTKSHEYVFLLSKSPRYFYDQEAVREPHISDGRGGFSNKDTLKSVRLGASHAPSLVDAAVNPAGRNLRSVWQIATEPYPGAHFATFPQKLVEPCIKAGTSERGVCPECGAPWVREVAVERGPMPPERGGKNYGANAQGTSPTSALRKTGGDDWYAYAGSTSTTGWRPCACLRRWEAESEAEVQGGPPLIRHRPTDPIPATVLDPFAGSGTTGLVANRLGRRAILIDLSADYIDQAMLRNQQAPLGIVG